MRYDAPQEPDRAALTPEPLEGESNREPRAMPGQRLSLLESPILDGRLHPLTIVFGLYNSVKRLILPSIPLLFFGSRWGFVGFITLLVLGAVTHALIRYFTFSYRIEGGELITRQGVLERRERHIPVERVQEIRIEQGVLHRLFGVVDATIETAGGKGPEASLSVLSREEAERLRQAVFKKETTSVFDDRDEAARPETDDRGVVRRLNARELVLAGLTSNHLLSALALVGTLWAFLDDILPEDFYERIAVAVYGEANRLLEQGTQAALLVALIGIMIVFLASLLFSVIGSVARFYGFTLSRSGEDLQRAYGLFTRRSSSLPRRRIQVLEIQEGFLRRPFNLAALRADTAGDRSTDAEENKGGRDVLIPILPSREVSALLPVIFPDIEKGPVDWSRVSRLAIVRGVAKGVIACVISVAAIYWYQRDAMWLWLLILLLPIYWVNVMRYKNLGYVLGERFFRSRRGRLSRSTHIVPIRNAQAIVVRQSPVDRWLGLATLVIDTAGQAYTGGGPHISNLPLKEARSLAKALAHRAAATRYRW